MSLSVDNWESFSFSTASARIIHYSLIFTATGLDAEMSAFHIWLVFQSFSLVKG
jgi:hypothetical protein